MSNIVRDLEAPMHSMTTILQNTAIALGTVTELVQDLEIQLLETVKKKELEDIDTASLQTLDLLSQSIMEISLLIERLSRSRPDVIELRETDIVDPIRLEYLRCIIRDGGRSRNQEEPPGVHRNVSLF